MAHSFQRGKTNTFVATHLVKKSYILWNWSYICYGHSSPQLGSILSHIDQVHIPFLIHCHEVIDVHYKPFTSISLQSLVFQSHVSTAALRECTCYGM